MSRRYNPGRLIRAARPWHKSVLRSLRSRVRPRSDVPDDRFLLDTTLYCGLTMGSHGCVLNTTLSAPQLPWESLQEVIRVLREHDLKPTIVARGRVLLEGRPPFVDEMKVAARALEEGPGLGPLAVRVRGIYWDGLEEFGLSLEVGFAACIETLGGREELVFEALRLASRLARLPSALSAVRFSIVRPLVSAAEALPRYWRCAWLYYNEREPGEGSLPAYRGDVPSLRELAVELVYGRLARVQSARLLEPLEDSNVILLEWISPGLYPLTPEDYEEALMSVGVNVVRYDLTDPTARWGLSLLITREKDIIVVSYNRILPGENYIRIIAPRPRVVGLLRAIILGLARVYWGEDTYHALRAELERVESIERMLRRARRHLERGPPGPG